MNHDPSLILTQAEREQRYWQIVQRTLPLLDQLIDIQDFISARDLMLQLGQACVEICFDQPNPEPPRIV